ncbi:DUF977 family protein [Delftia lacustris]|uniref:DUF977 family protein n=1 Tax=Delftia lacustris TaxID=558537 RepID=UPI001FCAC4F3|nr:DUF977 family protein [Delftia lacustris]BDE74084.1 hypothetical protein HQS1_52080 [Delftia lacustris]
MTAEVTSTTPPEPTPEETRTTRQIICDTIQELVQQNQVVTRETLMTLTGKAYHVIDDHISRMIHVEGTLRRVRAGVFVPQEPLPEPRAVSVTDLPDGTSIIEIGDLVLRLYPRERRSLATRLAGDAIQLSNIQAAENENMLVNEVIRDLKKLKRDLGV